MILNFTLSEQEQKQAREQIYDNIPRENWSFLRFWIFFTALLALLVFAFTPTPFSKQLSFLLNTTSTKATLIIGLLICCIVTIYFKVQSNLRNNALNKLAINRSAKDLVAVRITDEQIVCTLPEGLIWTITPDKIYNVIELENFLVLLIENNEILCIPHRVFRTGMDRSEFREHVKELIPFAFA